MCDVDETLDAWTEKWRVARKTHECCACGETIRPGDRYHYGSGVWDGRGESYKHCARCWEMLQRLTVRNSGPVDLFLACGEEWEEPPDDVAALAFLTPDEAQTLTGAAG